MRDGGELGTVLLLVVSFLYIKKKYHLQYCPVAGRTAVHMYTRYRVPVCTSTRVVPIFWKIEFPSSIILWNAVSVDCSLWNTVIQISTIEPLVCH
jgi:hypothetical protein